MVRRRREAVPTIPPTIQELVTSFNNPLIMQHYGRTVNGQFFHGSVTNDTGTLVAVVFLNEEIIAALTGHHGEICELGMDGTFKVVPTLPRGFVQLFSVHVIFMNVAFPIMLALMCFRTESAYVAVLQHLKEAISQWNVRRIIMDFEIALRRAVRVVYAESRIGGCWFHYCQAVWRQVNRRGLVGESRRNPNIKLAIKMIMALPHLPAQRGQAYDNSTPAVNVLDGLRAIREFVQEANILQINSVLDYFQRFWLGRVGAENFSIFNEPHRTNNHLEAFHSRLLSVMGAHPNIWQFIKTLIKCSNKFSAEMRTVIDGRQVRPFQRATSNTLTVRHGIRMLLTGEYNVRTFLRSLSHTVDGLVDLLERPHVRHQESEEEEEEEEEEGEGDILPQAEFQEIRHEEQGAGEEDRALSPSRNEVGPVEPVGRTCRVCLQQTVTHIILPCGHLGVCTLCAETLNRNHSACPYCRGQVTQFLQFFEQ
ncbi:uncharacterized protein LOC134530933 isoform X2 [Bacillus rossius redtenbacheri]